MKVVFVDTGFWIARFKPNDTQSARAAEVRYPRQSRGLGFVSPSKGQEAGVA